jgi:hypothetical protein
VPTEKLPPRPPRPTLAAADRPVWAIFHHRVCRLLPRSPPHYSTGGRLSVTVGRAAFSFTCSSSPPQRSPPPTPPVNCCAPRAIASVIHSRRPAFSYQPRTLARHPCRACFAAVARRASPQTSRLATADSCRARPCGRRCQRRCIWCVPTERTPTRPLRPTLAAADRPVWAIFHLDVCRPLVAAHTVVLVGRLSFSVGQAACSACDLQFSSSARASTHNARELLCRSSNRVGHLLSSARLLVPASHRCLFTCTAYASPPLPVALRLWLHGSARLILAVRVRVQRTAKVVAGGVCRPRSCHPGRSAQPSLQPTGGGAAIFHSISSRSAFPFGSASSPARG